MTSTLPRPDTRAYVTVNPATGELVKEFPSLTDAETQAVLQRAHEAFLSWRRTTAAERAGLFSTLAELVQANAVELGRLVSLEMGKPAGQAVYEAGMASSIAGWFAENGEALLADEEVQVPGFRQAVTRREPVGVILAIEPWNAPLYQAMRAAAPNLMLGNTVLLKPAEITAGSTLFLVSLFEQAGFPADVIQTALVSTDQVSTLVSDARVRGLTLTGSDRAGSAVGEQAGRHIKPAVLELGGSDAFVVLDSADVAKAAGTASACRLAFGGQVCASPKRVIVTEKVADDFIAQFNAAFGNQQVGDPFDPSTTIGPLSSQAAVDLLQDQYQDAIDKGATVLVEGGRVDGIGAYFKPAVITDITPEMRLYSEEAFGPLAMIFRVPDADGAIQLANDSIYGLGGTVFGEDVEEARAVAGQLDTGMVGVNNFLGGPIEIPFGGTKRSGYGRELGKSAMDQFANIKTYGIA
ncbi:aldehyde dehydrogenase family protein [Modestobacter excelsi]|uniref:aldehyde dehydrogenase family protein n=1 Tax=Modestobacter excelsi TaxID=2213161 RepID=UPI00110C9C47|nr:aldehyde dehydrogenase family protein [Modestobacter excelsi]